VKPLPKINNEAELIHLSQGGDLAAFEKLMNAHAQFVYNLALRTLGDAREAEDVTQDAMLRAWNGLPRFRAESSFKTWLYRIVTNLCYNRLPRLKRDLRALDSHAAWGIADESQRAETGLMQRELRGQIHQAIDALPDHYRMLITMRYLQELSYAEIAEATSMPLGTVKTGIHRGRMRLRKAMQAPAHQASTVGQLSHVAGPKRDVWGISHV